MDLSAGERRRKENSYSGYDLAKEDTPCNEERQDKEYRHKTDFATEGNYG